VALKLLDATRNPLTLDAKWSAFSAKCFRRAQHPLLSIGHDVKFQIIFNTRVHNIVEICASTCLRALLRKIYTGCTHVSALGEIYLSMKKSTTKSRLDKVLVDRQMVPSRERAQALVLAGKVLVDGQKIEKSGTLVDASSEIRLLGEDLKYVGRGGLKLERALQHWNIDVHDRVCLDVGASTGGFTDCLLQHGAARVIAIDTGQGQIAFRLRQDPRVRLLEKTNARYLSREQLGETADLIAIDVSFISATLVLPAVISAAFTQETGGSPGGELIVLVKPQFEVGRDLVGKGGIVRDHSAQQQAVEKIRAAVQALGANSTDVIDSPILGAEGNREFLLYARF
jgi:23S rRNA (cytidine1920-2'-O)/16S rRNA (cytidine1409-2'-O)-methyltransferase